MSYVSKINGYDIKDKTARETLKFHAIAKSSATYIAEFPNGKNMIVDTGMLSQWNDIKTAIDNLGITKFDYMIITHIHSDHTGNIQNFINTYDFSECTCWIGMKPDFTNHAAQIDETESDYDNVINLLQTNNINPIVPQNDSYYVIDENTKLHFLNTSQEIAENYYGAITEWRTEAKLNYNHFSLVTEIMHFNNVIMATGDIEKPVEEGILPYVHKVNVMTTPHHGVNKDAYKPFYKATMPEYSLSMYITQSETWLHNYFKSFRYLEELGCKMITAKWTIPVNGLYSFFSGMNGVTTNLIGESGYTTERDETKLYENIRMLINYTETTEATITLQELLSNMLPGSRLLTTWWNTYNETFAQLYSDLQAIFPDFTDDWILEINRGDSHYKQIKVHNRNHTLEFKAESYGSQLSWNTTGEGEIANITGTNNLVSKIGSLPKGSYTMSSYRDDSGSILIQDSNYALTINTIDKYVSNGDTITSAVVVGTLRGTGSNSSDKTRTVIGYINTSNNPTFVWHKTNSKNIYSIPQQTGMTNLINYLKTLPVGHYVSVYKDSDGTVLDTTTNYEISIDLTSKWGSNNDFTAIIHGVLKNTTNNSTDIARVVSCYINTTATPQYLWHKLNN